MTSIMTDKVEQILDFFCLPSTQTWKQVLDQVTWITFLIKIMLSYRSSRGNSIVNSSSNTFHSVWVFRKLKKVVLANLKTFWVEEKKC